LSFSRRRTTAASADVIAAPFENSCPIKSVVGKYSGGSALTKEHMNRFSFSRLPIARVILFALACAASANAATPFVDSVTRNGSFETGSISPWSAFSSPTPAPVIVTDPAVASDGQRYAVISAAGSTLFTAKWLVISSPALAPAQGDVVRIAFDARLPASGDVFDVPATTAWGSDPSDTITTHVSSPLSTPLSSASWAHQVIDLTLDPAKMAALPSMTFGIGFVRSSGPLAGHTYVGWVDNVTMTQIPEPTCMSGVFAVLAMIARRRCRTGTSGRRGH
jgi:hypothetical protein